MHFFYQTIFLKFKQLQWNLQITFIPPFLYALQKKFRLKAKSINFWIKE